MFDIPSLLPYFTPVRTEFTGSGGPTLVARPNPHRGLIYFSGGPGNNLILDITTQASANHGTIIVPSGGSYCLYWQRDGLLVTLAWYWYPQGAGIPLTVTELIWQPPGV